MYVRVTQSTMPCVCVCAREDEAPTYVQDVQARRGPRSEDHAQRTTLRGPRSTKGCRQRTPHGGQGGGKRSSKHLQGGQGGGHRLARVQLLQSVFCSAPLSSFPQLAFQPISSNPLDRFKIVCESPLERVRMRRLLRLLICARERASTRTLYWFDVCRRTLMVSSGWPTVTRHTPPKPPARKS